MLEILFWLFLLVIIFPLWLLSFILGKIGYKIGGNKGKKYCLFNGSIKETLLKTLFKNHWKKISYLHL